MRISLFLALAYMAFVGCNNPDAPASAPKKVDTVSHLESTEWQHHPHLPKDTIVIDYYGHRNTLYGVRSHNLLIVEGDMIFRLPTWWSRLKDSVLQKGVKYTDSVKTALKQPLYFYGIGKPAPGWPIVKDTIRISYKIDESIKDSGPILQAIHKWEITGVVRFALATKKDDHVLFKIDNQSASNVGKLKQKEQIISLRVKDTTGTIVHEIGHAIGLFHEQCRNDRERYLVINCPGNDFGTVLTNPIDLRQFPPYNLFSIMHYPRSSCITVKDDLLQSLPPKIPGQRDSITINDLATVKFLYHIPITSHLKPGK